MSGHHHDRKGKTSFFTKKTTKAYIPFIIVLMYSTKTIHKNVGQTYTSIGDPYKVSVEELPERWKQKQLSTSHFPLKNGLFTKLEYNKEKYAEIEQYTKTQPLDKRKLGFGSHDAYKSGEFTSTIATERYRNCVKNEMKLLDRHQKKQDAENPVVLANIPKRTPPRDKFGQPLQEPMFLYDIGRTQITPYTPQDSHDSFYKFPKHALVDPKQKGMDHVRRLGSHKTMSSTIGESAWSHKYDKPSYGIVNCVQKFYDRGHLEGCSD